MLTDDETAFLAALTAAPEDRAPHKIFADWLDERGRHDEADYHRRWTVEVARAEKWLDNFARRCGPHVENYSETCDEGFRRTRNLNWQTHAAAITAVWDEVHAKRVTVPFTRDLVVEAAREWLRTKDAEYGPEYFTQLGHEDARDLMARRGTRSKFWRCFSLVTGIEVDPKTAEDGVVFSCSC